jgi:hypothetical protein
MIDDRNDIKRPVGSDPYLDPRRPVPSAGYGWGIPAAIAAVLLIAGVLFFGSGNRGPDRTANNAPAVTQTNPSGPAQPSTVPAPPVR